MTKKKLNDEVGTIREFKPKTKGQHEYIRAIAENQIIICTGMAGTGKTACATALGCEYLVYGKVERLIITRPIIESGRSMGSLPGSMEEKIHPYLIPVLDELNQSIGRVAADRCMKDGRIEIVPLNYMRGRNFHNCFVIADEMSNATISEIKLLLTRIGRNCKMVLTGDLKQSDLPIHQQGGLKHACTTLYGVEDIAIINLYEQDLIRNPIIAKILEKLG